MFANVPPSVGIEKRDGKSFVVVHENGMRTESGPYTDEAAKARAEAERKRLGLG